MSEEQTPKKMPRYQAFELPDKSDRIEEIGKTYPHRDSKGHNLNLGDRRIMLREISERVSELREGGERKDKGAKIERGDEGYEP